MEDSKVIDANEIKELLHAAVEKQNAGDLQHAEIIYTHILEMQPDNFDALKNMAMLALRVKNYEAAMAFANKAMKINPKSCEPVNTLGLVFYEQNALEKAVLCFKQARVLNPQDGFNYNCLTSALHGQKKYEEALEVAKVGISLLPDNYAMLNNMGAVYNALGNIEEAIHYYTKSLSINNDAIDTLYNIATGLFALNRYEELYAFIDDVQEKLSLPDNYSFGLNIIKVIIHFQKEELELCKLVLGKVKDLPRFAEDQQFNHYKHYKVYCDYFVRLLDFHEQNTSLYKKRNADNIYILGDSHCLSPAYTYVNIEDEEYRCNPILVVGAQMRHLTVQKKNKHNVEYHNKIKSIPKHSIVVCMFGEIDTRMDDGILPYHKKNNTLNEEAINANIENIVRNYVEFCVKKSRSKKLKLILYGVPAGHSIADIVPEDKEWRRYIIKKLNIELAAKCKEKNIPFIDIYTMTVADDGGVVGDDGVSSSKYHMEGIHLLPTAFAEACERFICK